MDDNTILNLEYISHVVKDHYLNWSPVDKRVAQIIIILCHNFKSKHGLTQDNID